MLPIDVRISMEIFCIAFDTSPNNPRDLWNYISNHRTMSGLIALLNLDAKPAR
jgi:hypothetical protein